MRIITGQLKGRKIPMPKTEGVRPTSDRTKEGLFSALQARLDFDGLKVLDLFAGSGNLGFEALSRGASWVRFVEENQVCVQLIKKLAHDFELEDRSEVIKLSVESAIQGLPQPYDLVFADPPYEIPFIEDLLHQVLENGWLAEKGIFVLEHDKRHDFSEHPHCFYARAYGRTVVSMFTLDVA
jgi:16S rRNA (guanine(966)-N(2))-methyltransferase RsmD